MKRLAAVTLFALAMLLIGAVSLPFTGGGTRLLVGMANRLEVLDIAWAGGTLAGELQLQHVRVNSAGVVVDARNIRASLNPDCLWRSVICFSALSAETLKVVVAATDSAEEEQPASGQLLRWPVSMQVGALSVGQVQVDWPGGYWHQEQLSGGLLMEGNLLHIEHARLSSAVLFVASDDSTEERTSELELPTLFLPLDLRLEDLVIDGFSTDIGGVREHLQQVQLSARWRRRRLDLESLFLASSYGEAEIQGRLTFVDQWPLTATADVRHLALGDFGEHELSLHISGTLGKASLETSIDGLLQGLGSADVNLLDPGLSFQGSLAVTLPDMQALAAVMALPEQLMDVKVLAPVNVQLHGDMSRQSFALEIDLQGIGYDRMELRAVGAHKTGQIVLDSIALADSATASALQAKGSLQYANGLAFSADINSNGITLPTLHNDLTGRIAGQTQLSGGVDGEFWHLTLARMDLAGDINNLPATFKGHGKLFDGGRLGATQIEARLNGAQLDLQETDQAETTFRLQVEELSRWNSAARGGLTLQARRPAGSHRFTIQGQMQQPGYAGLLAEGGRISGFFSDTLTDVDLSVELLEPAYGNNQLDSLRLHGVGGLEQHRLTLHTQGDIQGQLILEGAQSDGLWRGTLAPTEFDTRYGPWQLATPVNLGWVSQQQTFTLQPHCWKHTVLAVCVARAVLGTSGAVQLAAEGSLNALNGLLPRGLELAGSLDASLDAQWDEEQGLNLTGFGESRDVSITRRYGLGESTTIGWDRLFTRVQADASGMKMQAEIDQLGRPVFELALMLPPSREGVLSGRLQLEDMHLQSMAPWVPELSRLKGTLNGDLQVSGTMLAPLLHGSVAVAQGNLAMVGNPTEMTDLSLTAQLEGAAAVITGSAVLGGGELQLQGQLQLEPSLLVNLTVTGNRHQILVPPSTEVVISENLEIRLVPGQIDVRGEIDVLEGLLRHEQLPPGSVDLSPDVVEVDLAGNPLVDASRWEFHSDVWVRIKDRFKIEGDSLTATIGGDVQLRQGVAEPLQLFGTLNILGGELRAFRQQLLIRRGTIAFSGPLQNPELDVRAEREIREQSIVVGASLQGRLDELQLKVYSDPAMSQGEAMSYLVRGRGLDSGAGADGTALALSMGTSVINSSGILSPLNRLPGINNVELGSTGSDSETAATVSGYVGERIYISYGIGLYEHINVLTARLYLQTRLWLEVVSRLENSVDIYYSFDID